MIVCFKGFVSAVLTSVLFYSTVNAQGVSADDVKAGSTDKIKALILNNNKQSSASVSFTENRGQVVDDKGKPRPDVLFSAKGSGTSIYLTATGIHYQFKKVHYPYGFETNEALVKDRKLQERLRSEIKSDVHRFTVSLDGANPKPLVRKEEKIPGYAHFYLEHCPQGITNVSGYHRIIYENVYPGIDWILYSNESGIKYDFLVHPEGNPGQIKLKISDADKVSIAENGDLIIKTSLGEVHEQAPVSFSDGRKIPTQFKKLAGGLIGFEVDYTRGHELRIDPSVTWATYYGGSSDETGAACASDAAGYVYLAGQTVGSSGLASSGGLQTALGGSLDAYLVKFDSTGTRMWATYYGGSAPDNARGLAIDATGNVYMAGISSSSNAIATTGSYQSSLLGSTNAFLVKFNSTGTRLWGTYYGGLHFNGTNYVGGTYDDGFACAVDGSGNVYMTGRTTSNSFIASGGYQNTYGGSEDAFLVKFNSSGSRLWATYYGGNDFDRAQSCATDNAGNIYVAGYTYSTSGIASGGHQNTYGGGTWPTASDAFLVKFDSAGTRQWGTYYGNTANDQGLSTAVDGSGNVYLAGTTNSTTAIASGGFQNVAGGAEDAFIVKFSSSGTRQWGSYLGGSNNDNGTCLSAVGSNIYLGGTARSSSGIASGGFQSTYGGGFPGGDAFVAQVSTAGALIWSSYFGGASDEYGSACAATSGNRVYLSGTSSSTSGIASSGYQNTFGGGSSGQGDAFLASISNITLPTITTNALTGTSFCIGSSVSVPFTSSGTFNTGNVFTAQLSDASGSFTVPVNIGTLASTSSGSITANIPSGSVVGTSYRIRVISSNPVVIGSINGTNLSIASAPAQPGSISGNTAVCSGSSQTYSIVPVSSATSYTWTLPSGWSGSASSTTMPATAGTTGGTISVTASNVCGTSAVQSLTVSIMTAPAQPGAITGSTSICNNTAQQYRIAAVPGATSYTWSIPAGWSGVSAVDSINVMAGTAGGTIQVNASNSCGSSPSQTLAIAVTNPPSSTPVITGAATVCKGSAQLYYIAPISGATSYNWTIPGGWIGTSNATSISVTAGSIGGTFQVTAINLCGSSFAGTASTIVIDTPNKPGTIAGNSNVCLGTGQSYSVPLVPTASSYTWSLPSTWTGTSNANTITGTVGTLGGTITVTADNMCGSSQAQSMSVVVNPNAIPTPPIITFDGTFLISNVPNVEWYGSSPYNVLGTGSMFRPTASGYYHAVAVNNGCNSAVSNIIYLNISGELSVPAASTGTATIYPNPTTGKLMIDFGSQNTLAGVASLYSVTGQKLKTVTLPKGTVCQFDISDFADGVYFLEVRDTNPHNKTFKVVLRR